MNAKQVTVSMNSELCERAEAYAKARGLSRSAAISELVTHGLESLEREREESALARRLDEVAAVAYANHALIEWYLPQAFQSSENRRRPRVTGDLGLVDNSDYFLAVGNAMARNRGNLGFALAETAGHGNDFKLNVKANDFVDRADFAAYYSKAGLRVQSERDQRERAKQRQAPRE